MCPYLVGSLDEPSMTNSSSGITSDDITLDGTAMGLINFCQTSCSETINCIHIRISFSIGLSVICLQLPSQTLKWSVILSIKYHQASNIKLKIPKLKCFSSHLAVVFVQSIYWSQVLSWEWRCSWSSADRQQAMLQLHLRSTNLLLTKVQLVLEFWQYARFR